MRRRLPAAAIAATSSHYLREGRKQECWELQWVEIDGDRLYANVAMTSFYAAGGPFHLTIFSALEIASQLLIIYGHDWDDLSAKVREGWMVESTTRTVRAITSSNDISVEMHARKRRKMGKHLYGVTDFTVTDAAGGLFEITLKGFLA
jgi:hypothetical protein